MVKSVFPSQREPPVNEIMCYSKDSTPKNTSGRKEGRTPLKLFSPDVVWYILGFLVFTLPAGFIQGSEFSGTEVIAQCPGARSVFVDSTTGIVYAACSGSGVIKINETASVRIDNSRCTNSQNVFFNSTTGIVYVACSGSGVIKIKGETIERIDNNACPDTTSVSVDSTTGIIYASCNSNGVIKINKTASVRIDNNMCTYAQYVSVDSVTGTAYASCGSDSGGVIKINKTTSVRIDNNMCSSIQNVFFDSTTGIVYAACFGSGVIKINGETIVRIDDNMCTYALRVFVDSTTGIVYATCRNNGVIGIDGGVVTVMATISQCLDASSISVDSITGTVYAICPGSNTVIKINGGTSTRIDTGSACTYAQSISVDSTTNIVYSACGGGGARDGVIKINGGSSFRIDNNICTYAISVSVDSTTNTIYAACGGDGNSDGVIKIKGESSIRIDSDSACSNAQNVFVDATTGVIYAACDSGGVIKINKTASVRIGNTCALTQSVSVDSTTGIVYATCSGTGRVFKINETAVVRIDGDACSFIRSVFIDSTGIVYAACESSGVLKIDKGTISRIDNSMCSSAQSVFVDSITGIMYAACGSGGVIKINGKTSIRISSSICNAQRVFFNNVTGVVYVACFGSGVIALASHFNCPPGYYWTATGCSLCPLGSFHGNTISNLKGCTVCPSGSVAHTPGSVSCTACAPGTRFINAAISCLNCAPGFYSNISGSISCSPCRAGYYGGREGLTNSTCDGQCEPGYWCSEASASSTSLPCDSPSTYCPKGSTVPTLVPQGFYATDCLVVATPNTSPSRCSSVSPCTPGTYCENGVQGNCAAGSFSLPKNAQCTFCSPGRYQELPQQSQCIPCPAGSYSPSNATNCTPCSEGTYISFSEAATCIQCAPGTYQNLTNQTRCIPCDAGRYSNVSKATSLSECQTCPAGYSCLAGSSAPDTTCESSNSYCPPGSSTSTSVPLGAYATNCIIPDPPSRCASYTDCTPGTYCVNGIQNICTNGTVSGSKQSKCDVCGEGKYQPVDGQSICLLCPPGTSQPSQGSSSCNKCNAFLFASGDGNTRCSPCPEGNAINSDQTGCISSASCPDGHSFNETEGSCTMCRIGTFSLRGVKCQPSPPNTYSPLPGSSIPLVCPSASGISCSNGFAFAQEGYWLYTSNNQTGAVSILPCLSGACVGGTVYGNQCDVSRLQSPSNIMCGECADGYSPWGSKCYSCKRPDYNLITLVVFYSMAFVGIMHYLSQSAGSVNLSIFFYFVQVGIIICGSNTGAFVNWLNIFNFRPQDSTGSCLLPLNSYQAMAADVVIPFLYFGELGLILVFHLGINYCFGSQVLNRPSFYSISYPMYLVKRALIGFDRERYIRTFTALYLTSFSTLLTLVLRYVYCIDVGSESVLYFNPAISCSDSKYKQWRVLVVLLLVLVICLIPITTVLYLWRNKSRLNSDTEENKIFAYRWGILHEPFSSGAFYYQGIILLRRLLVGVFATVLVTQPTDEYLCFALMHAILCIVHNHVKPYKEVKSNTMEELSLLLLILLSCVLLAYPPPSFSNGIVGAITVLYVVPSILVMLDAAVSQSRTFLGSVVRTRNNRRGTEQIQRMDPSVEVELDVLVGPPGVSGSPSTVSYPFMISPEATSQTTVAESSNVVPRLFPSSDSRESLDIDDVKADRESAQRGRGARRRNRSVEERSRN